MTINLYSMITDKGGVPIIITPTIFEDIIKQINAMNVSLSNDVCWMRFISYFNYIDEEK